MSGRRTASLATVVGLTGLLGSSILLVGTGSATGEQIRTETTLGGYSIDTNAAPFKVLVDDPTLAIPRPPDAAVVEVDPAYSHAVLDVGPTSRGVGASLWPGALFGDGIGTATGGAIASYPLKAEARYPDKPYVATQQDNGAFMRGEALGLDVMGTARMNPAEVPGQLDLGLVASTSTATVKDGVAIGTSVSKVSDVSLLGGIITVGSVSTTLTVRSDGKKGTSTGSTTVSGLTIGGVGYVVDDQGVRPVGLPVPGSGPLPTGVADPLKALGITVGALSQQATHDATSATRDAKGLVLTVDTVLLRAALDNVPSEVTSAVYGIVAQLPKEIQGFVYTALTTTPKITFILGAGQGRSSATLPLSFDFPPLAPFVPPAFDPPLLGGTDPGPVLGDVSVFVPPAAESLPGPTSAVPTFAPVAQRSKDPFAGIPPVLLLVVLAFSGTAGWGLTRLRTAALLGAAAGPCTDGSSPTLPDLRGA